MPFGKGCNEIPVTVLYNRVQKTRGNFNLNPENFMEILRELDKDGLFEFFGDKSEFSQDLLIARSQMHPSVPYGDAILL